MERGCMKDNIWLSIQLGLGLNWSGENLKIFKKIFKVLLIILRPRFELANQDSATDRYHS